MRCVALYLVLILAPFCNLAHGIPEDLVNSENVENGRVQVSGAEPSVTPEVPVPVKPDAGAPRNHLDDNPRAATRLTAYAPPAHAHIHKQPAAGGLNTELGEMDDASKKEHEDDFKYFDINNDGFVDGEEMRVVFVEMGDVSALDEMMQFFEDVDADHSGTISWEEYFQYALLTTS